MVDQRLTLLSRREGGCRPGGRTRFTAVLMLAVAVMVVMAGAADGGTSGDPRAVGGANTITDDLQVGEFLTAIAIENNVIRIAGNVELKLSGQEELEIAKG